MDSCTRAVHLWALVVGVALLGPAAAAVVFLVATGQRRRRKAAKLRVPV